MDNDKNSIDQFQKGIEKANEEAKETTLGTYKKQQETAHNTTTRQKKDLKNSNKKT